MVSQNFVIQSEHCSHALKKRNFDNPFHSKHVSHFQEVGRNVVTVQSKYAHYSQVHKNPNQINSASSKQIIDLKGTGIEKYTQDMELMKFFKVIH